MQIAITPPSKHKSTVENVQYDEDTEQVEWLKTYFDDGSFQVTGFNIIKKQIYNG